jgi:hypothetical protein
MVSAYRLSAVLILARARVFHVHSQQGVAAALVDWLVRSVSANGLVVLSQKKKKKKQKGEKQSNKKKKETRTLFLA